MQINTKKTLRLYWQHTKGYRPHLAAVYLAVMAAAGTGTIVPLFFKKFFDTLTLPGDRSVLIGSIVSILVVISFLEGLRWLAWRVSTYFNAIFTSTVIAELSKTCFRYLHKHSFSYFNNNFVGTLVKRFAWFTRAFESVHDKIIWNIIPLVINLSVTIVVLWMRRWWLSVVLIIWLIIFLLINWIFTKYKLRYDLARAEAESKTTGLLADTITNHGALKLFTGYKHEVNRYSEAVDRVRQLRRYTWHLDGIFDAVQGLLVIILEIGIFYGALRLWEQQAVTVGDFVLIQAYVIVIFHEIWGFGKLLRYLFSDLADAEEMTVMLTTPHEIKDTIDAQPLTISQGTIVFREVQFNYHATRKIISDLSFTIGSQEKVGLIGPSGAGKTTIIKLLLRQHDLTAGAIKIDGQRLIDITMESLWSAISLVPQDPILFHRTLIENIRYGKPEACDAEVVQAAKLAHCHEFISEFPDKYKTFVGERGVKLSGGERQRVAIARAILRNAPILILDEATSSLDSESESLIQDALVNLMQSKTVIVIAHRLSTIMKMDRILVINHGSVVEQGSHDVLLKKDGLYKQLWKRQAGGFMTDEPAKDIYEGIIHEVPESVIDIVTETVKMESSLKIENTPDGANQNLP